jgi:lipoyltransferase/lipoate-protein ligase
MLYITLPDKRVRRLSFYLAMEEYVAKHVKADDCFFMWQVEPSVIFGRNQLIENEVNLEFCRKHNIQTYRRKSGGGCVYADMNNVMFSYITSEEQVGFTFNRYINMVVHTLQRLGVDASPSGRNDVMIGDKKVSGNAFYKIPGRSIVHGTMLYDTDMLNMVGAITPPDTKLMSKGIQSIHQRVDFLKNHISLSLPEFMAFVHDHLCDEDYMLRENDVQQIERMEQEYLSEEFIYGKNPHYTIIKRRRIENVGDFEARIELKNGIIKSVNLMGDYFLIGNLDEGLLNKLKGVPLEAEAISCILPDRIDDIIMNLLKADFIDLLTSPYSPCQT